MAIGNSSAAADFTKLHNIDYVSFGIIALCVFFNVSFIVFVTLSIYVEGDFFLVDEVTFLASVNLETFPIFDNGFVVAVVALFFPNVV